MFRIIILFCFLNLSETASKDNHLRVIGGRDVVEGEYPYVVLLVTNIVKPIPKFCTGSAISHKWVLTAGHCTSIIKAEQIFILHTNVTKQPEETKLLTQVHKIFIHPQYQETIVVSKGIKDLLAKNDICLLLVEELRLPRYGRLLSTDHKTLIGLPVEYVGGGMMEKGRQPRFLPYSPLQVGQAAIKICEEDILGRFLICIAPKCSNKEEQPLQGDSGGPLVFEDRIIGVCSSGSVGNRRILPVVEYTAVSPYIDWISNVMQKNV